MEKKKWCETGEHWVPKLWKAKSKVQQSCCQSCLPKHAIKTTSSTSRKEEKKDLNVFFAEQALIFPKHCENCGEPLNAYSVFDRRKMTCHILQKTSSGGFPTVATHPQNKLFMCCMQGCYGHEKYDNGDASDRIKMPVYSIAVERFKMFEHLLTPREKIKAYKYLNL